MRFGVREICDVVLKAKAPTKIGNKVFYKNEPVIYFDSLKTSSMEGAATTVYAQGGRGNSRLIAWEGERTVTFTMEDALISPEGFMILSGAGLIEASSSTPIYQHIVETTDKFDIAGLGKTAGAGKVYVEKEPYFVEAAADKTVEEYIYVMAKIGDDIVSEPYLVTSVKEADTSGDYAGYWELTISNHDIKGTPTEETADAMYQVKPLDYEVDLVKSFLVDYYVEKKEGARQIEITPDKFGGNYYLEASTLFRDTNGVDMPAEFIIPNCKIQSNFTFTMASSGDPSTFTFTMDAFPDYTRFDSTKKVLSAIQIISNEDTVNALRRTSTAHTWDTDHADYFNK